MIMIVMISNSIAQGSSRASPTGPCRRSTRRSPRPYEHCIDTICIGNMHELKHCIEVMSHKHKLNLTIR